MRLTLILLTLVLFTFGTLLYSEEIPTCLIYDSTMGPGSDESDSTLVARTLKYYIDRSGKFDSIIYNPELSSVLLAVQKEKLTVQDIQKNADINSKLKVAQVLDFNYVMISEVSKTVENITVNLNVCNLKTGVTTAYTSSSKNSDNEMQYNNSIHSVCSAVIGKAISEILGVNPNFSMAY